MKRVFNYLALAIVAATAFVSCNKEKDTIIPEPQEETFTLTFASEKPELIDAQTRTVYTNGTIEWAAGDKIRVGIKVGEEWMAAAGAPETDKFPKLYVSEELAAGGPTAQFKVPGSFTLTTVGTYKFYGLYPSSLTSSTDGKVLPNVSITIPDSQTPTANSFDSKADVMFAVSEDYPDGIPSNKLIDLTWSRVVAHADITLTKLPTFADDETLSSIEFYAQEEADLAGTHLIDITDGTVSLESGATGTNKITVIPDNVTVDNTNHTLEFWFSSLPFTASSIKIVLTTNKKIYTKEYTGITREFMRNRRNVLSIGMKNAAEQDVIQPGQVIPNGDYVIAVGGKYNVMMLSDNLISSTGSSDSNARAFDALPAVSSDGKVHTAANAVWTIQYQQNGKYSIKSVETGTYLSGAGNATYLSLTNDGSLFDGTYDSTNDTYQLKVTTGSDTRGIGYNTAQPRFAMYKGSAQQPIDLKIIPAVVALRCKTPVINYEAPTVTITCATDGASIYYTTDGSIPTSSSTLYEEAFDLSETATVKAVAVLEGYEDSPVAEQECTIVSVKTIAEVIAAASGSEVRTSGVVAQINLRGFVITDGTNNINVNYQSGTVPSVAIGQEVEVYGTRGVYNGVANIGSPTTTPGATGQTVTRTTLTTVTSANAKGYTESVYVSLTGSLTSSGSYYNVSIAGSSVVGSLYLVSGDEEFTDGSLSDLVDKMVTVTGYVTGSSNSYLYIAPVDIIIAPDISISPATTSSSPAAWPADNDDAKTFTVTATNGTWAITDDTTVSGWATISTSGNEITVTPKAKQATEAHSGQIVITLTPSLEGYESKTATIYLSQARYSSGGATYTLTFPDDNSDNNGVGAYTETWTAKIGGHSWTIKNFNNNNWNNWTYIKCGRKNYASTGTIVTSISEAIATVKVTVDAATVAKVNSFKLYVASDASFSQNVQTVSVTIATGENSFTIPTPVANSYYKIEVDCASGSNNGLVTISKVLYTNE